MQCVVHRIIWPHSYQLTIRRSLAPGALTLLTMLVNDIIPGGKKLDPNTEIRHLSVEEWALIVQAFDEWPFAPEVSSRFAIACHLFIVNR